MEAFIGAFVFIFGLACGSFLNVCITRLPADRSVIAPRSACPECGHAIRWYDNVPLLSWLWLRARCRDCRAPIALRYPIVELATPALFLACYLHFVDSRMAAKFALFTFLNVGLAFTDLEARLLPDEFTLGGLAAGLALSLATWVSGWVPSATGHVRLYSLGNAAFGALIGAGLLFLIGEAYRLTRGREGMGLGDVKLAAMMGSFLGAKLTLLSVFLAATASAVIGVLLITVIAQGRWRRYRNRKRAIQSVRVALHTIPLPFGTFLAAAAIFCGFFGTQLLDWYFSLG